MNKEELLKALMADVLRFTHDPETTVISLEQAISRALDRYALSIVEQSVPEERPPAETHLSAAQTSEIAGFNSCRAKTIGTAHKLTHLDKT